MTREEQIREAVKMLGGGGREPVKWAIEEIEFGNDQHQAAKPPKTKDYKLAVNAMVTALRRARVAHNNLPPDVQHFVFGDLDLGKYEKDCRLWLKDTPSVKPKRDEFKKRLAAREAHDLLRRHGYTPVTTRGKPWCELAAILYGDRKADLYKYCCELQKAGKARLKPRQR